MTLMFGIIHIASLVTMAFLPGHDISSWLLGFAGGASAICYIAWATVKEPTP